MPRNGLCFWWYEISSLGCIHHFYAKGAWNSPWKWSINFKHSWREHLRNCWPEASEGPITLFSLSKFLMILLQYNAKEKSAWRSWSKKMDENWDVFQLHEEGVTKVNLRVNHKSHWLLSTGTTSRTLTSGAGALTTQIIQHTLTKRKLDSSLRTLINLDLGTNATQLWSATHTCCTIIEENIGIQNPKIHLSKVGLHFHFLAFLWMQQNCLTKSTLKLKSKTKITIEIEIGTKIKIKSK